LRGVINDILATRGEMVEPRPVEIPPLPSPEATRQHVRRYLDEIGRATPDLDLQHYLLLGALAELLVRVPLDEEARKHMLQVYAESRRRGPTPEALTLLFTTIERVSA
jgi:hypothetical protein